MEIIEKENYRLLVAEAGHALVSVTDGSIVGHKLILGINDSEIHYTERPIIAKDNEE